MYINAKYMLLYLALSVLLLTTNFYLFLRPKEENCNEENPLEGLYMRSWKESSGNGNPFNITNIYCPDYSNYTGNRVPQNSYGNITADTKYTWGTTLSAFDPTFSADQTFLYNFSKVPYADSNKLLRVCIATNEFPQTGVPHGGIGSAFFELARVLLSRGHQVRILLINDVNYKKKTIEMDGRELPVEAIEPIKTWVSPDFWAKRQYYVLSYFLKREGQFDIVHFHDWVGNGQMVMLAKQQGWAFQDTTFVVGLHGPEMWATLANHRYPTQQSLELNYFEQTTVGMADVVVSPSAYLVKYLANRGWKFPERTYVIQNVLPPESVDMTERPASDVMEFVFFGRLEPRKGCSLFVKALDLIGQLVEEKGIAITFLGRDSVIGGESSRATIQDTLSKSKSLTKATITFLDNYSREQALYYLKNNSRMAVIPSLTENSPYTVLECIMNRVKFIASAVGGIPELLAEEDRHQLLFAPNPKALAAKLKHVISGTIDFSAKPATFPEDTINQWMGLHYWLRENNNSPAKAETVNALVASNPPPVAVCITHHERVDLLRITLVSLLEQNYPNFMIGIVDDGSSTESVGRIISEIIPFLERQLPGRSFVYFQPNAYLGAARNYCAGKFHNVKYITFIDDDDVIKPGYLEKLVRIAEYSKADVLSTFFDVFTAPPLTNPIGRTDLSDHHIYVFTGGDLVLPIFGNVLGGANIFMRREVFDIVGGFTTYFAVGYEDYEFLVRSKLNGLKHLVVPDPMIYIRNTAGSMMKRDDPYHGQLRVLSAYMDHPAFKPLNDVFLIAKGLLLQAAKTEGTGSIDSKSSSPEGSSRQVIVNSKRDFSSVQGKRNWYYGFRRYARSLELNVTRSVWRDIEGEGKRWITATNEFYWPFIDGTSQHPSIINHVITCTVRRWLSWEQGDFMATVISEKANAVQNCGDGVDILLIVDGKVVFKRTAINGDWMKHDVSIHLKIGSKVDLVVDPKRSDTCDATFVELEIWIP